MSTSLLRAYFDDVDYGKIRNARMRGTLQFSYYRKNGDVYFSVPDGMERKFFSQIDSIVDFGATTPREVFSRG